MVEKSGLIIPLITIIQEDESIKDETIVDIVNNTTKEQLKEKQHSLNSFLAGLFIYIVRYTNNQKMQNEVKVINHAFVFRVEPPAGFINNSQTTENTISTQANTELSEELSEFLIDKDIVNIDYEAVVLSAKEFLLKYENALGLVPLCQMAYVCKPHHKHCRQMYTEYSLLAEEDRAYILEYCECIEISNVNKEIIGTSLKAFINDVEKYDLSEKRFLYIFNQYYPRIIEYYANRKIDMYDLESFIRLYTQSSSKVFELSEYSTLDQYIYDYLWFRINEPLKEMMRPLDYLWFIKRLDSCKEFDLTFWACRFIIDACNNINVKNTIENIPQTFVEEYLLETQEDMYYYSLVCLYNNWLKRAIGLK